MNSVNQRIDLYSIQFNEISLVSEFKILLIFIEKTIPILSLLFKIRNSFEIESFVQVNARRNEFVKVIEINARKN